MEKLLEDYLAKVEKYLRPLPVSERCDIIQEIKSELLELRQEGKTPEEIVGRLGDSKELARAYLGSLIAEDRTVGWTRILTVCAFYSLVGFSGMVVIPCLGIMAPVFILCGVACPVLGAVKLVDHLLHLGIPYMDHVGIFLEGGVELSPVMEFAGCLLIGALLYWGGRGCWKLLMRYLRTVSGTKEKLSV